MAYSVSMETRAAFTPEIWDETPPVVQEYMEALETRFCALESIIRDLQEQNAALQEQLTQNSRNSSRPPSSDGPGSERPSRPEGKRGRGGQPGHPGHARSLLPVEEVDEVLVLKPEACSLAVSSSSARHSAHPTCCDRISVASTGLSRLRRNHSFSLAQGCSQRDLWSSSARHSGVVYGVVSLVQAHDPTGAA